MIDRDKLIFAPCDIMLPPFGADERELWKKWAVIACDQHTEDVGYWQRIDESLEGAPSALDLVLPEAYLGTELEAKQKARVDCFQRSLDSGWLKTFKHSLVLVERTLSNGLVRRGIVGKIDLENYDFSADSRSYVRPTEGTVTERVPPRVAIRKKATFELSHVMMFARYGELDIDGFAASKKAELRKLYEFDLAEGGGHIAGWLLSGEVLEEVLRRFERLEAARAPGDVLYAVGDGNHSLAAAASFYRSLKEKYGPVVMSTKARYATVEMVSVDSEAIVFEPIYRVVENVDTEDFLSFLASRFEGGRGDVASVTAVCADGERPISVPVSEGDLTVGVLQDAVDCYLASHPTAVCDYIHGVGALKARATAKNDRVGLLFEGMKKEELFPYVESKGPLPRKTFSMGSADTKRYYLELRRIKAPWEEKK